MQHRRWFALSLVCLSSLMMVLDATIVDVLLPAIQQDLGFSQQNLAWIVNAYLLTLAASCCWPVGPRICWAAAAS